jgi:ATP-dependent RNA helicase MSS116
MTCDAQVKQANSYARTVLMMSTPPPVLRKCVASMGLKGVPGLNVVSHLPELESD